MYIQELSQKTHLSKKAIHFYEEKGLIHPQKDEKGYRIYHKQEQDILLKIKLLRQMNFSIAEIKQIIITQQYEVFDNKKKDYENQIYDIETSIQYIDEVKEYIEKNHDVSELLDDMEKVYDLKNIDSSFQEDIDFSEIIFFLVIIMYICTFKNWEIGVLICVAIILGISKSTHIRTFIFHMYEKIRK